MVVAGEGGRMTVVVVVVVVIRCLIEFHSSLLSPSTTPGNSSY